MCPAARAGRGPILGQKCVARQRRTLHPPSGGAAAPRLFDRITVADAPKRDQGVRPTRRKLVNRHDRGGAPAIVPGTHARRGQIRRLGARHDHRRYAHTARRRQSSGGLHQHRQDPLIMPDPRTCRGRPNAPSSGRISTGSGWPWAALILGRVAGQPLRWVRTTRQTCPASATSGRYWTCYVTQLRWPAFSATVAARLRRRCAAGRFGVGSVASRLAALSSRELRSDLGRRAGTSPAYC